MFKTRDPKMTRKAAGVAIVVVLLLSLTLTFQNCSSFSSAVTGSITAASSNLSSTLPSLGGTGSTPAPTPVPTAVPTPVPMGASGCGLDGVTLASGSSRTFYFVPAATATNNCRSEARTCANGTLSGSAAFASCTPEPADGIELISDVGAKTGFLATDACPDPSDQAYQGNCSAPVDRAVANPFFPQPAGTKPKWTIQQWGSKSSMPTGAGVPYADGRRWANNEKFLAIFPNNLFEMGIDGNSDFNGVYRQQQPSRQGWPSLYFGFNVTNPYDLGNGSSPISTMKHLNFNFDAYLTNTNRNEKPGYDPNQNSVIFVIYFTVQNLNQASAGFGQYIWMGVPVYNDIERFPGRYVNVDSFGDGLGTNMLIYSTAYTGFSSISIWDAQWTHLSRDLMPDVREAFSSAIANHNLKDGDLSNYYLSGMVIGYEVTGLNTTWIQFRTPSLKVVH
jgi:hypothetical protein